jgi:hypothetical protein
MHHGTDTGKENSCRAMGLTSSKYAKDPPRVMSSKSSTPQNRACIFNKRRLFENRSVYAVKTSVFGVVILPPLSCHFWRRSTLGLHSIYSSASELPL